MKRLRELIGRFKREVVVLWFCTRHPRTPLIAKALAIALVAYAFSPIDLIPDFIPVLGYVDDLILLPIGIWLVMKLVPVEVIAECTVQAERWIAERRPRPRSYIGAALIVVLWLALIVIFLFVARQVWRWAGS